MRGDSGGLLAGDGRRTKSTDHVYMYICTIRHQSCCRLAPLICSVHAAAQHHPALPHHTSASPLSSSLYMHTAVAPGVAPCASCSGRRRVLSSTVACLSHSSVKYSVLFRRRKFCKLWHQATKGSHVSSRRWAAAVTASGTTAAAAFLLIQAGKGADDYRCCALAQLPAAGGAGTQESRASLTSQTATLGYAVGSPTAAAHAAPGCAADTYKLPPNDQPQRAAATPPTHTRARTQRCRCMLPYAAAAAASASSCTTPGAPSC